MGINYHDISVCKEHCLSLIYNEIFKSLCDCEAHILFYCQHRKTSCNIYSSGEGMSIGVVATPKLHKYVLQLYFIINVVTCIIT